MLSLHTNHAALSTQKALSSTSKALGQTMAQLGTGYRVNSAMDDAAGLQIATRLEAQSHGMKVAQRNTQNGISMLQTAEGALSEVTDMLLRMRDLAIASATASSSVEDRQANQQEFDALGSEIFNIMSRSSFAGKTLFAENGSMGGILGTGEVIFQIGASSDEQLKVNFSSNVLGTPEPNPNYDPRLTSNTQTSTSTSSTPSTDPDANVPTFAGHNVSNGSSSSAGNSNPEFLYPVLSQGSQSLNVAWNDLYNGSNSFRNNGQAGTEVSSPAWARYTMSQLEDAIGCVSKFRSELASTANRLEHTYSNLSNMLQTTEVARGRIMDVDYASATSAMTQQQMLMQASTSVLKQSSQMSQMVASLLQ